MPERQNDQSYNCTRVQVGPIQRASLKKKNFPNKGSSQIPEKRLELADDRRTVKKWAATAGHFRFIHRPAQSERERARVQVHKPKYVRNKKRLPETGSLQIPEKRLELLHDCSQQILSLSCLPFHHSGVIC